MKKLRKIYCNENIRGIIEKFVHDHEKFDEASIKWAPIEVSFLPIERHNWQLGFCLWIGDSFCLIEKYFALWAAELTVEGDRFKIKQTDLVNKIYPIIGRIDSCYFYSWSFCNRSANEGAKLTVARGRIRNHTNGRIFADWVTELLFWQKFSPINGQKYLHRNLTHVRMNLQKSGDWTQMINSLCCAHFESNLKMSK